MSDEVMDGLYALINHDWFVSLESDGGRLTMTFDPSQCMFDNDLEVFEVSGGFLEQLVPVAVWKVEEMEKQVEAQPDQGGEG